MAKYARTLTRYTFIALALLNFLALALTFLSINISYVDAVQYFTDFFQRMLFDLFFIAAAAVVFLNRFASTRKWLFSALPLSLTRIFYIIPYSYLYFEYTGYDTRESLLLALAQGALDFVLTLVILIALSLAAAFLFSHATGSDEKKSFALFDFSSGYVRAAFAMSLAVFLYDLIGELVNTVDYLIEYAGTYRTGEIIYIIFSYLFMLAMLVIMHTVGALIIRGGARYVFREDVSD